jgi:hypothetical protein
MIIGSLIEAPQKSLERAKTYSVQMLSSLGTARGYQGQHMQFTPQGAPVIDDPKYVMFLKVNPAHCSKDAR